VRTVALRRSRDAEIRRAKHADRDDRSRTMSEKPTIMIPHDGYVLVGDGRKALILRNEGTALEPRLRVQRVFEAPPNPPTHEQGTERPPRVRFGDRRSALEQPDWHEIAEHRFAATVAAALDRIVDEGAALVIAAPPRTLSELRHTLSDRVRAAVIADVDKDLTRHTVDEIQRHLCGG